MAIAAISPPVRPERAVATTVQSLCALQQHLAQVELTASMADGNIAEKPVYHVAPKEVSIAAAEPMPIQSLPAWNGGLHLKPPCLLT